MSRVRRARSLVILAAGLLLSACPRGGPGAAHGGGSGGGSEEPPPPELLSLLPEGTFAVLRADMVQVRESPYYGLVVELLRHLEEGAGEQPVDFLDIASRIDEVVAAMTLDPQGGDEPRFVVLLRGRFGPEELETTLRSIEQHLAGLAAAGEAQPAPLVAVDRGGGHRVLVMEGAAMASLGQHTWVLAAPEAIDGVLARADGTDDRPGPRGSETFRELAVAVGFHQAPVAAVVEVTPRLREAMIGELSTGRGADRVEAAVVEALVGGAARAEIDQGIRVQAQILTTNPLVASATADLLDEVLAGFLEEGGLAELQATREVRVDGPRALVTVGVDDAGVRSLLASPEAILALLGGPADEPASQDPPPPGQEGEPAPSLPPPDSGAQ